MSQFATRFKHRQHTENITDDDECPIHLFNYPCYQQADIRMHSYGLRQLVDDKFDAIYEQTCRTLIVKTFYPQTCCKLFQQVLAWRTYRMPSIRNLPGHTP